MDGLSWEKKKILAAEDDPAILAGLADLLRLEGYDVTEASDGRTALDLFRSSRPDLVILDVMMPFVSGYDVCREIRRYDRSTPILMLTAKTAEADRVVGLELGADDYIVKPFGMAELLARVRAALRRAALTADVGQPEPARLEAGDLKVDFDSMTGVRGQEVFSLTPKENSLLRHFAANEGRVLSREALLEAVWDIGVDCDITTRSVDQHVARLRQKIEGYPPEPKLIVTVHGAGYRFDRHGAS
ncbi:MAG: response regulator transcription factor [Synergistaceae bacterium]|jgi:DNA-binding response OmpR family regulator|nr:response regulator transcription factor [Synergistaceae bacterium]